MQRWILIPGSPPAWTLPPSQQADQARPTIPSERYDEGQLFLSPQHAKSQDFFDPVKSIPIGDADWYLPSVRVAGVCAYRYDYFNNTEFGAGKQDENGFHLLRMLANVDAHFGPNFRALSSSRWQPGI